MPDSKIEKVLPYTGVLAGILFAVLGFVPKLSDKYADPHAVQIMNDNSGRNYAGVIAAGFFCVAMLFFAAVIRSALRSGDGGESLATAAFGGGVLIAAWGAISAWLLISGLDAADHHDKAAVQTLSYLGIDGWLPWVAASAVFFLATGLGSLRNGVFPRWFAIITVILGVLCMLGPTGIAVYFATPLWLIVAGVLLGRSRPVAPAAAQAVA